MPRTPPVRLQELDLADDATAAAVHRVGSASYAVEAELIGFDGIPALRESLDQLRRRPLRWLGALTGDGAVAGFAAWEEKADGRVCLDRLCVDPAWFRRGVASLLLGHLLSETLPHRTLTVTTGAANAPAVALYERLGFVRGADFSPVPELRMASFTRTPARTPAG